MKLKYFLYLLLAAFIALVVYRIQKGSGAKDKAGSGGGLGKPGQGGAAPAMRVNGIIVNPSRFENSVSITGTLEPNEQVQIRSEISGLVKGIFFKEGSQVKKGQTLIKIDDAELRAQLSQAITRENLAAENERRAKLLLAKEAISREEYDASLAEYKSLRSQVQLVRAQLSKTTIAAPFSGKIGLRAVSVGEYLTPSTVIANLVSADPIKLSFAVPEKYASQVKVNTPIQFTVAGSTQKYHAVVYAIEPAIESASRSLLLKARADNPSGKLLPGLFANVELPLAVLTDAILVPTQAIIPVQEGKKVFVADSGKAKEVMVETSTRTANQVLIVSGLKTGDTVLTSGMMSLKKDAPVKVKLEKIK